MDLLKRIILLTPVEHYPTLDEIFYFDALEARGYGVETWNVGNFVLKGAHNSEKTETINGRPFRYFVTLKSVYAQLKTVDIKTTLFIVGFTYTFQSLPLWLMLRLWHCRTTFFARGVLPFSAQNREAKKSFFRNARDRVARVGVWQLIRIAFERAILAACRRVFGFFTFDLMFAAGKVSELWAASYTSRVVGVNYFDYDRYLSIKDKQQRPYEGRFILFLDEFLPDHPDFPLLGIQTVNAAEYYLNLNQFFSDLENKTGLNVVIAAHPKAKYTVNPFAGRRVCTGVTAELMRDCELVLAHMSTSIGYAAIFEKPLFLIMFPCIEKLQNEITRGIQSFSTTFKAPLVSHASEVNLQEVSAEKRAIYKDFVAKFHSATGSQIPSQAIVLDALKNL